MYYEIYDLLIKWEFYCFYLSLYIFVFLNFGYLQLYILNIICNVVLQFWKYKVSAYSKYDLDYICQIKGNFEKKKKRCMSNT